MHSCIAENVSLDAATAADVPRVDSDDSVNTSNLSSWCMRTLVVESPFSRTQANIHKMLASNNDDHALMGTDVLGSKKFVSYEEKECGGGQLVNQPISDDRSATTVVYLSHGQRDWLSPVYGCSLSANRSYVAMYHHVCLQNAFNQKIKLHDARHLLAAVDQASVGHEDMTKQADMMKMNESITLSSHPIPLTDIDAVADKVRADESVLAATTAGKAFNTSTLTNATQKSSTTNEHDKVTAANTTPGVTKVTARTKTTTTSGKNPIPAAVNKTAPAILAYKDLVISSTSSSTSESSTSKKPKVDDKSNTKTGNNINQLVVARGQKPSTSIDPSDLPHRASAILGIKGICLPQRSETWLSDINESLAMRVESTDGAKSRQYQRVQSSADYREEKDTEQHVMLVETDDTAANRHRSRRDVSDKCEQRLRSMDMKLLQLENQMLRSTVDRATGMKTTVELENHVMRLERELMRLNQSLVEMNNNQLRQRNSETAAATNDGDQQHKIDQLTDLVNKQTNFLVALQSKCDAVVRDNRLLVERILNQSMTINEMLLHVEKFGREQTRLTLQLMELKQRCDDSCKPVTVSHGQRSSLDYPISFPGPPVYKSNDDDAPKGKLSCPTYESLSNS